MSPRLPALILLAAIGGGAFLSTEVGARPFLDRGPVPVAGRAAAAAQPAAATASTWYCAGGTAHAGGFADHSVLVSNPTDHEIHGTLTVVGGRLAPEPADPMGTGSQVKQTPDPNTTTETVPAAPTPGATEPVERVFAVSAGSSLTFRLSEILDSELAAAVVETDSGGITVDHRVVDPAGRSDVAPCTSAGSETWHFAWGSTARDAREVLVLFNPYRSDVTVDGIFSTEGGTREPLRWQGVVVPARSVVGVDLGDDVTRRDQVSASLRTRGGLVVADRIQAFDGTLGKAGLNLAAGAPDPQTAWGFPAGRVGGAHGEQIVLYNPSSEDAEVDVSVLGGQPEGTAAQPFGVVVRPESFELVDFAAESRVAKDVEHATIVRSRNGVPVVAERVATAGGRISGGPGALFAATSWILSTTPASAGTERIVLLNTHPRRTAHVVSPVVPGHVTEVAPNDRAEIAVPATVAGDAVLVRSDVPVVAERVIDAEGGTTTATPAVPVRTSAKPL